MNNTFFDLAEQCGAYLEGDFTLKSGLQSPYFFNMGAFFQNGYTYPLAKMYVDKLHQTGVQYDVLFGPAYKGIPLVSAMACVLSLENNILAPIAFNRKEMKSHGEKGSLVGSVRGKRILVVDDVLTAGTALRESIDIIQHNGGKCVGAIVGLDREETAIESSSSITQTRRQALEIELGIPIHTVAKISQRHQKKK